jgi:hypothetical protein
MLDKHRRLLFYDRSLSPIWAYSPKPGGNGSEQPLDKEKTGESNLTLPLMS